MAGVIADGSRATAEPLVAAHTLLPPQQYTRASSRSQCAVCTQRFSPLRLKHHCRQCGEVVCVMCYTPRPVNVPVVGLRRVKICLSCTTGDSGGDASGSSGLSGSSASTTASSRNASARSLAARKIQQIVSAMAPIVVPSAQPHEGQEQSIVSSSSSSRSIDSESLRSAWEISDLEVPWVDASQLRDVRVIGSGGNGVVWLVQHRSSQSFLAAKRLIGFDCSDDARARFVEEVRLVAQLTHPRIVHFVGAAWTPQLDLQALFEFMPTGDLRRWLTTTKPGPHEEHPGLACTPWKLQAAIDVADALAYVHAMDPPLVHRDIKSKNILLDEHLRAKLTDFGVSRFESRDGSMTTGVGTGRWLAPEVLNGGGDYGTACDVYSFGVLLSELDTHDSPYSAFLSADDTPLPEMRLILLIAAGQVQPSFSPDCPATLHELALTCLSFEPAIRPRAKNVAASLRAFQSRSFQ